jgi:hypothetical protein
MKRIPETARDHATEKHVALSRRAARLAAIREKRDDGTLSQEIFQVSQALILCGLPYQPTTARHFTRKARLADGSTVAVTFSTALEASMPYGSDRTLLHFLMDRAVKTGSRFVSWETATEFLETMNLATGGKNRRDLRERFKRIAGLTIGVERKTADSYSGRVMPVIGEYHLPTSIDVRAEVEGTSLLPLTDKIVYGVEIEDKFFKDLLAHHVPIPAEIIRATRKQSQLQDLVIFLYWRCFAAQSTSLIKWEYLRQQVWQDDKKERRIKERFAEAITCLRTLWPEVNAEALSTGLSVGKPRGNRYLLVEANNVRKL